MAWLNGKRTVYCRRCYKKGHNKRNCPELTPEQKAAYKDGDKARRCSYCGEPKHNKAGCEKRKTDRAEYIVRNAEYRKKTLDTMAELGLGIGALVTTDKSPEPQDIYMITETFWDNIQEKRSGSYIFKGISVVDSDYWDNFAMPGVRNWHDTIVMSPVSAESIRSSVPEGWLNGTSGIHEFFE